MLTPQLYQRLIAYVAYLAEELLSASLDTGQGLASSGLIAAGRDGVDRKGEGVVVCWATGVRGDSFFTPGSSLTSTLTGAGPCGSENGTLKSCSGSGSTLHSPMKD